MVKAVGGKFTKGTDGKIAKKAEPSKTNGAASKAATKEAAPKGGGKTRTAAAEYAERMRKLSARDRYLMKVGNVVKRMGKFTKEAGSWSPDILTALQGASAAMGVVSKAFEALPDDFVPARRRRGSGKGLAPGTPVMLTEKAQKKYEELFAGEGIDLETLTVKKSTGGKVIVQNDEGMMLPFARSELCLADIVDDDEAPPKTKAKASEVKDADDEDEDVEEEDDEDDDLEDDEDDEDDDA